MGLGEGIGVAKFREDVLDLGDSFVHEDVLEIDVLLGLAHSNDDKTSGQLTDEVSDCEGAGDEVPELVGELDRTRCERSVRFVLVSFSASLDSEELLEGIEAVVGTLALVVSDESVPHGFGIGWVDGG